MTGIVHRACHEPVELERHHGRRACRIRACVPEWILHEATAEQAQ